MFDVVSAHLCLESVKAEPFVGMVERTNAMSSAWDDMAASAMLFDGSYEIARERFGDAADAARAAGLRPQPPTAFSQSSIDYRKGENA